MFRPVKIRTETSPDPRIFHSLEEATEYLLMNWPAYQSSVLDHARQTCLNAIAGKVSKSEARAAFVAAAKEAGIHIGRSKLKKAIETVSEVVTAPLKEKEEIVSLNEELLS